MDFEKTDRLHAVIAEGRKNVDDQTASIAPELFGLLEENGGSMERRVAAGAVAG